MKLTALLIFGVATLAMAADKSEKKAFLEKAAAAMGSGVVVEAKPVSTKKALAPRATTDPSLTLFGAVGAFTVAPGASFKITSQFNYTGADTLAVALECPTGTDLSKVGISAWWSNSFANNFTLTDVILGSDFFLSNMGGGTVPVYGTQLLLYVVNTGTAPISCDQLTTYAVVH
jgi:hypothetical protein